MQWVDRLIASCPDCRFWLESGIGYVQANELVAAGIRNPEDLGELTREQFLALPKMGTKTLERCERILGRSLAAPAPEPSEVDLERDVAVVLTRRQWRRIGFGAHAAVELNARGMTLNDLGKLGREELLGIKGIGDGGIAICERLTGRVLAAPAPDPALAYWREKGFMPRVARALVNAGVRSVAELSELTREDLSEMRFVGSTVIGRLEALAGCSFPQRNKQRPIGPGYWTELGLSARTSNGLDRAGIHTLAGLRSATRESFLSRNGLGAKALAECESYLGFTLPSVSDYWSTRGAGKALSSHLATAGIQSLDELARLSFVELVRRGLQGSQLARAVALLERHWREVDASDRV